MPLLNSEIAWKGAVGNSLTPAQNGGRMGYTTITSGIKNNIFSDVSKSERDLGSVRYRKVFLHVASTTNVPMQNVKVFLDKLTQGQSFVTLHAATATGTEDNSVGRAYGIGTLDFDISAGATTLNVTCEDLAYYTTASPFRVGDVIRISSRVDVESVGDDDFAVIDTVTYGTPTVITLTSPLTNGYYPSDTTVVVSSVIELTRITASITGLNMVSTAGNLDALAIIPAAKGGISDNWTITFTSDNAFSIASVSLGTVGTGSIYSTAAPNNPNTSSPYFSFPMNAWSGTWASGDTVTFETVQSSYPIWLRREIPTGAASIANDTCGLAVVGESA